MKINQILKSKKAESTPLIIAFVLVILLLFCAMSEFFRLTIIAKGVRDTLQTAVISVATTNYDEVYNGLREGYSGGYKLSNERWQSNLDYYDVYSRMDEILGTKKSGNYHIKEQGNSFEYRFSDLNIEITNTGITNKNKNFEADVTIIIEIPLSFGWENLPPLEMEIRTKAAYMPKF